MLPTCAAAPAPLLPLPGKRRTHLFRIPPDRPILALDVSKDTLVATFDPRTSGRVREWTCPNTAAGIQQLLSRTPPECCWVLEPTGRYSNQAVDLARAAQRRVFMAEPRRAQAFLGSGPDRAKTDRVDSRGRLEYAAVRPLPEYPRPSAVVEHTEPLLSARRGLSQALARLQQQQRELPHAAAVLTPACDTLRAQLTAVDRPLAERVAAEAHQEELGAAARLDAVPGIGPVTAAAVATCLPRRAFSHPDQCVAHVGLDLTVRDSGRKQGKRELSQRGDGELRRLLYLAAQANLRCAASPFRQQDEREKAKGLPHTAAVCAVARKLAKVCWSLVKHQQDYDPQRVYQAPPPPPSPPATAVLSPGKSSEEPATALPPKTALDTQP